VWGEYQFSSVRHSESRAEARLYPEKSGSHRPDVMWDIPGSRLSPAPRKMTSRWNRPRPFVATVSFAQVNRGKNPPQIPSVEQKSMVSHQSALGGRLVRGFYRRDGRGGCGGDRRFREMRGQGQANLSGEVRTPYADAQPLGLRRIWFRPIARFKRRQRGGAHLPPHRHHL